MLVLMSVALCHYIEVNLYLSFFTLDLMALKEERQEFNEMEEKD